MKYLVSMAATLAIVGCTKARADFTRVTETWVTDQGTFALDHVSGNKVDVTQAFRRKFLGRTFYFEGEGDARRFDLRPWPCFFADPSTPAHPGSLPQGRDVERRGRAARMKKARQEGACRAFGWRAFHSMWSNGTTVAEGPRSFSRSHRFPPYPVPAPFADSSWSFLSWAVK